SFESFGVLLLTLHDGGYEWEFRPATGGFVDAGTGLCHSAFPSPAADFHTLPPCRLLDTRLLDGPTAGAPLAAGTARAFAVAGLCGVPETARAVAANVTVVAATAAGDLQVLPQGLPGSPASTLAFKTAKNLANNAVLTLGVGGRVTALCTMPGAPAGTAHLVLDVSGYFE